MKKLTALLLVLLTALSLCACGAAAREDSSQSTNASYPAPAEEPASVAYSDSYDDYGGFAVAEEAVETEISGGSGAADVKPDKIIYSADARIETTEFDKTISRLNDMIGEYGGWIQSSSVNGANYYNSSRGFDNLRSASYVIRIPSDKFNTLMSSLSTLGNVPYSHSYTENVTAQYYDVNARLNACRTQETTLLAMMEKAETVSDVITIEDRLTELRYQIESLQSSLNNWDRQVSYSSISLDISEVEEYTPEPQQKMGYWQEMWAGFTGNLKGVSRFFKGLLLFLVSALPTLVVLAAIFFGFRLLFKNRRTRKADSGSKPEKGKRRRRAGKSASPSDDTPEEIIAEVVSEEKK